MWMRETCNSNFLSLLKETHTNIFFVTIKGKFINEQCCFYKEITMHWFLMKHKNIKYKKIYPKTQVMKFHLIEKSSLITYKSQKLQDKKK